MTPTINPKLLERLEEKLGVGRSRLYSRISSIATSQRIERNIAALVLAADSGIGITRFSTTEERAAMRGVAAAPAASAQVTIPAAPARIVRRATKKQNRGRDIEENTVFVVHGRDAALTKSMFDFLLAIGLRPVEFENAILMAKGNNPHLQEILDAAMAKVQAVVVLLSPDDDAMLTPKLRSKREPKSETTLQGQPRQNVLFETGLAMGSHLKKTIVVQVGTVRGFSDILGRHIPRLSNATEKRNDLINRLEKIGCKVNRQGVHWMTTGDFTPGRLK